MTTDEKGSFVKKAHGVSDNLTRILTLVGDMSPETIERKTITEIAEIVEDITRARTSLQRFRLMEKLEEHAERVWMVRLAVLMYASKILDLKSVTELDGTADAIRKMQEELNENPIKDSQAHDSEDNCDS